MPLLYRKVSVLYHPRGRYLPPVHSHVIDEHLLREYRRRVGIARPLTTDSDIQDDEEGMVDHPRPSRWNTRGRGTSVLLLIDKPANLVRRPFNNEDVEIIGECSGDLKRLANTITA